MIVHYHALYAALKGPAPNPDLALYCDAVSVFRGGNRLLEDLTLKLARGSTTVILGPNGCGKSSLLKLLCGYLYPTSGTVYVLGRRFGETSLASLRREIRLVQPAAEPSPSSAAAVRDVVLTGRDGTVDLHPAVAKGATPQPAIDDALLQAAIDAAGLTVKLQQPYGTLSTGERTRTLLARALLTKPQLLLLDEPTTGLDVVRRAGLLQTLQSLHGQLTQLIVTHHVEEIPASTDTVCLMSHGRVIESGLPREQLTSEKLSTLFGRAMAVTWSGNSCSAALG